MSQEKTEANAPPALQSVESVSARVNAQGKLVWTVLGLSSVSLLAALLATVVSLSSGEKEAPPEPLTLQTQFRNLERQLGTMTQDLEALQALAQQTHEELNQLSTRVGRIDTNDGRNAIVRLQQLMITQEQDFQHFVSSLEQGSYNLHMVIPHSIGWWDEYKAELNSAMEMSKARENYALALREN